MYACSNALFNRKKFNFINKKILKINLFFNYLLSTRLGQEYLQIYIIIN